jgi:hypothetical protein
MPNTYQIGADPSRLGLNAANTGLGNNELFLKQFAGEVLTTFEESNVMMPLHMVRTISSGKSATFPVTGVATAKYHTPGESITAEAGSVPSQSGTTPFAVTFPSTSKYLSKFAHSERIISIDDMLLSAAFVANIDEAKNHYDVRSIYTTEIGRQLAYVADKNLIRTVIAGATRTTDRFGVASGTSTLYLGSTITYNDEATGATLGDELVAAFFNAARQMDEKNVPSSERYAIVTPEVYYQLVAFSTDAINRDFNPEGNGSIAGGMIMSIAGIRILKSNHIPTTDEAATAVAPHGDAGIQNDVFGHTGADGTGYRRTTDNGFLRSKGVIFQKEAVGTVKLLDLGVESEYQIDRQGTLMVAKYAMGHGVLREECCFWLRGDAA